MHFTRVLSSSFLTSSGRKYFLKPPRPNRTQSPSTLSLISWQQRAIVHDLLYWRCKKSPKTWKNSPIISPDRDSRMPFDRPPENRSGLSEIMASFALVFKPVLCPD